MIKGAAGRQEAGFAIPSTQAGKNDTKPVYPAYENAPPQAAPPVGTSPFAEKLLRAAYIFDKCCGVLAVADLTVFVGLCRDVFFLPDIHKSRMRQKL